MALQINPANFAGMASQGGGNLNLTNGGALGLQALQLNQAQQAAQQENALKYMQLQQQGQMGLLANQQQNTQNGLLQQQAAMDRAKLMQQGGQFDQSQQLERAKLAMQGSQFDTSAALDSRKLDLADKGQKQDAAIEMQKQMAKLLDDNTKETLKEKGAFASYLRISLEKAKSPEEAQQISTEALKEAVANKYVTPEQAKLFSQAPLSQRKNMLDSMIIQYGVADEHMKMYPVNKTGSGGQTITLPDGTVIQSAPLTTAEQTATLKDISSKEKDLMGIGRILRNYDEEYLTTKGKAGVATSSFAEKNRSIPVLGAAADYVAESITGRTPEERKDFLKNSTKFSNEIEQFFNKYKHEITGAAAAEKEIQQLRQSVLNGEMSPSQFKGSVDQLVQKTLGEQNYDKYVLGKGIDTEPKSYKYNPETGRLE